MFDDYWLMKLCNPISGSNCAFNEKTSTKFTNTASTDHQRKINMCQRSIPILITCLDWLTDLRSIGFDKL